MAFVRAIVTSFAAGIWSPKLYGRVDHQRYSVACRRAENVAIDPRGGAEHRRGTRMIAPAKDHDRPVRLFGFQFSTTQTYVLAANGGVFRYCRDKGEILADGNPVETAIPWTDAQLPEVQTVQSHDVMWLMHPDVQQRRLTRSGHADWSLTAWTPSNAPQDDGGGALWSSANGWPSSGYFFGQRLYFGGVPSAPGRFDGSVVGDFDNFLAGSADDDAVAFTIASNSADAIVWITSSDRAMLIGTRGGIFAVTGGTPRAPITPGSISVLPASKIRAEPGRRPLEVGANTLFVQQHGRRIREVGYSFERDGYAAGDMLLFADHLTAQTSVVDWAYQQSPEPVIYVVLADGRLLACSYVPDQEVIAWSEWRMAGTDAAVESVAVIPGDTYDELWLAVRRTVGGATRRTIEVLEAPEVASAAPGDAWHLDCALKYQGAPATVFGGLAHLEGEAVGVWADGAPHPDETVSGGQVTLDRSAETAIIGLGYSSLVEPMPIEAGAQAGTAQGTRQRISELTVRFDRSWGCSVGPDEQHLRSIHFLDAERALQTPVNLYTGDHRITPQSRYGPATIVIRQDLPAPMRVTAVIAELQTHG